MNLPIESINLAAYSPTELLQLRARIDEVLPSAELEDINLSEELIRAFQLAKGLLDDAREDDEIPLSQKSATLNSINAILKNLAELQKSLSTVERQQKLERALVAALQQFPGLQDAFFCQFEQESA